MCGSNILKFHQLNLTPTKPSSADSSMDKISLGTVVQVCVARRSNPQLFNSLFKQLVHDVDSYGEVAETEVVNDLLNRIDQNDNSSDLKLNYLVELLVEGDSVNSQNGETENDSDIGLITMPKLFAKYLPLLRLNDQYIVVNKISKSINKGKFKNFYQHEYWSKVLGALNVYSKYLGGIMDNHFVVIRVYNSFLNLIDNLIDKCDNGEDKKQFEIVKDILDGIQDCISERQGFEMIRNQVRAITKRFTAKFTGRKEIKKTRVNTLRMVRLKKLMWLDYQVVTNYACLKTLDQMVQFLNGFTKILNVSENDLRNVKVSSSILYELLSGCFESIDMLTPDKEMEKLAHDVWYHFIVVKVPLLVQKVFQFNQETLWTIMNSFETTSLLVKDHFVVSCAAMDLIKAEKLSSSQLEILNDKHDLSFILETLSNTNPEFVSVEECEILVNLERSFPSYEHHRNYECKLQFLNEFGMLLEKFISSNDTSRLNRLLISCLGNERVMESFLLYHSPYIVLRKLVTYASKWDIDSLSFNSNNTNTNDSTTIDADYANSIMDDDDNLQYFYFEFNILLLAMTYIYQHFNLKMNHVVSSIKGANRPDTVSFVLKFISSLQPNYAKVSYDDDLINEWVNCLFLRNPPSGHAETGISDSLIKRTSIARMLRICPQILKESITCVHYKLINFDDHINNALELIVQPFLILTILPFLANSKEIQIRLSRLEHTKEQGLLKDTYHTLLKILSFLIDEKNSNDGNEGKIMHKVIFGIVSNDVYQMIAYIHDKVELREDKVIQEFMERHRQVKTIESNFATNKGTPFEIVDQNLSQLITWSQNKDAQAGGFCLHQCIIRVINSALEESISYPETSNITQMKKELLGLVTELVVGR